MGTSRNRNMLLVLTLACGVSLYGCGEAEETTQEEATGEPQPLGQEATEAKPQEKSADDAALTSFVGEKEPSKTEPAQTTSAAPSGQLAQYEKQIEDLRTENTSLKQKIVKLEQDNRTLNTMMSESESKIQAARQRGDSLEQMMAGQPAMVTSPVSQGQEPAAPAGDGAMSISSYEDALRAFNARRYDEAMTALQAMISQGVQKDLEDNCTYWIGESNFAKKRYRTAIKNFSDVLQYASSEKKGDAQFMMAQSYERLGEKAKAKEEYEKVVKEYPLSKVVKKAKERWARL